MSTKIYLDTNVFVYAATNDEDVGKTARAFLEKTKNRAVECITSVMTLDEVLWVLKRLVGKERAHELTAPLLAFPNLTIADLTPAIMADAFNVYAASSLDPHDAVHLATMRAKNVKTIMTEDADFDKIKGVKRIKIE